MNGIIKRMKEKTKTIVYYGGKIKARIKDCAVLFASAHLLRELINGSELDLIRKEECDKNLIVIAFYPTGGFGDYIISSKLLDEILLSTVCRIDVYCENMVFGNAIYGTRPGVRVLPYESLRGNRSIYDVVLKVEHFVHVLSCNQYRLSKIMPDFSDKIVRLGKMMQTIRPEIEQQWYREAMHFKICGFKGINRYTELKMGDVFRVSDQYAYVDLKEQYSECIEELGLESKTYITINRGADSMGRSTMQTKVWPQEHYEEFVRLFKKTYPNFKVVQLGTISNAKIAGVDQYVLGRTMEVTKWVLKKSLLHIDCEGGLVHLATQLGTKCIVLFGPTPINMYAYPQNINLVSPKCSNCMGTHKDWAFSCIKDLGHALCMYDLNPKEVFNNAFEYLKKENVKKEISYIYIKDGDEQYKNHDLQTTLQISKKENPYAEQTQITVNTVTQVQKSATLLDNRGYKIAIVGLGKDLVGHVLQKLGHKVVEFDNGYGCSGKMGDTEFERFTILEQKIEIECRLGDEWCLPYESDSFDIVISKNDDKMKDEYSECRRIVKEKGVHILV
mgnify:FL=1